MFLTFYAVSVSYISFYSIYSSFHVTETIIIRIAAFAGGVVGGVVTGVLCMFSCLALCVCISFCCCYQKKKAWRHAAINTVRMTVAQPATVVIVNQRAALDKQGGTEQPELIPDVGYDPTLQDGCMCAPYPVKTLPPTYPEPGSTIPNPLQQLLDLPPDFPNSHPIAAPQ